MVVGGGGVAGVVVVVVWPPVANPTTTPVTPPCPARSSIPTCFVINKSLSTYFQLHLGHSYQN